VLEKRSIKFLAPDGEFNVGDQEALARQQPSWPALWRAEAAPSVQ